jgi:hypothetical protein
MTHLFSFSHDSRLAKAVNLTTPVDDLLGFGTRRLYNADKTIKEFQVDSGDNPGDAHSGYWKNATVIKETAKLLLENA